MKVRRITNKVLIMNRVKNKIVFVLLLIPVWVIVYKYLQKISDL